MAFNLPALDWVQEDESLRKLGADAGRRLRTQILNRYPGSAQDKDQELLRRQNMIVEETRSREQNIATMTNDDQALVLRGQAIYLRAFAIAVRPEGEGVFNRIDPFDHLQQGERSAQNEKPLWYRAFIRDWWRSLILLGSIGLMVFLSGDGGTTPILLIGILWLAVELLIGFRRLLGRRPSRQNRGNNVNQVSANEEQAEVIGHWRPGFRFVFFVALYLALAVVTSGLALIPLLFLVYPLWATTQQTKGNIVDVEGEQVQVNYWIRRSRIWLMTHKLTPRALAKMGRLTQMFVSPDGRMFIYQRDFPPLLIFTPDPDSHDLRQFTGGSKNVTIDRLSGIWSKVMGLAAPFGRIELIGPSKDRPLVLEGVVDPKRVGDILTSFKQVETPKPAMDPAAIATIAATVDAVLNRRMGGSGNGG